MPQVSARQTPALVALALGVAATQGCRHDAPAVVISHGDTFAEMRTVKGAVTVTPPGEAARAPYPRERLAEGEAIALAPGALAWIRRDGGAVWLVAGPARLTEHDAAVTFDEGKAFIDTEDGPPVEIDSARGRIELSDARASVDAAADGKVGVYVLRGSVRAGGGDRGVTGELLALAPGGVTKTPAVAWDDWTGGLATADPQAEPSPFGVGTVGARPPGDSGKPRFPLVVQRLDVKVTVDRDFAVTEVDETFVNPSADTVEGIFSFRTPPGAVLQQFGVDRAGDLVWGRIKESAAAAAQYQSNVYQGSTEDPALLQWMAPGVYSARLYPIARGERRRVVTRYAEWLSREGPRGERRLYVYPMAAEGARASLPRIEEFTVRLDLKRSGAQRVRAGMGGTRDGDAVVVKAFDFVPRADLAVELFDGGQSTPVAYRAPHALGPGDVPVHADSDYAQKISQEEPDYLIVPVRSPPPAEAPTGVDLAIVVDTSAATESGALAVARSLTSALLAQLGPGDRAALWAGDTTLRPVAEGSGALGAVDGDRRRTWLAGLSSVDRGGATDIGALLTDAATALDPKRRGAVVYIGDGQPSVGEIAPKALHDRIARLPPTTRILAAGLGSRPNMALLQTVARGALAEAVGDAYGAARVALRLLEAAQRPVWLGATVDLGPGVERVLPREIPPVGADEAVLVVGRLSGPSPSSLTLTGSGGSVTGSMQVVTIDDSGDLRRRWGEYRMGELVAEGAGRSALVDVGRRFGVVSPVTSLYVPTAREHDAEGDAPESVEEQRAAARRRRPLWKPWTVAVGALARSASMSAVAAQAEEADIKSPAQEGATGTRAKGEEGSMGNPNVRRAGGGGGGGGGGSPPSPTALASAMPPRPDVEMEMAAPAPKAAAAPMPAAPSVAGVLKEESFGSGRGLNALAAPTGPALGGGLQLLHGGTGGSSAAAGAASKVVPTGDVAYAGSQMSVPVSNAEAIIRSQIFPGAKRCYQRGLESDPTQEGRLVLLLRLSRTGEVESAAATTNSGLSVSIASCIMAVSRRASFGPTTQAGAQISIPFNFVSQGDHLPRKTPPRSAPPPPSDAALSRRILDAIGHSPRPCGPAADLSLDERRVLWAERLSRAASGLDAYMIYGRALADCEAPTWRERYALLAAMVDHVGSVRERVALWRLLVGNPAAAEVVYRGILVRVQTPAELRELHDALGLRSVDPDFLAHLLSRAKTPADRASLLGGAAAQWPDDLELALRVLDAYEDAGDDGGGRAWARRLRHRPDATSHVQTSVGEYYLRLAKREQGPAADRDVVEGRRTFGELVEFAPEDAVARRRLGDLLRAHGWYEEAFRQYETLAQLTPDDPSVPLLLACAAQGMGRIEEAVGWAEKAAVAGSPDGSSPLSQAARATASAFLAWARQAAAREGRQDDLEKLRARARRLGGLDSEPPGSARYVVTWSSPELHPALWTTAMGAPMPAQDSFPLFDVAEAVLAAAPGSGIELRLDPDDAARAARLGAVAVVTVIVGEGTAAEKIDRVDVSFAGSGGAPLERVHVSFDGAALHAEVP